MRWLDQYPQKLLEFVENLVQFYGQMFRHFRHTLCTQCISSIRTNKDATDALKRKETMEYKTRYVS